MSQKNQHLRAAVTTLSVAITVLFMSSGCAQKKVTPEEAGNPAVESTDLGSSDMGNALGLQTIHFAYDSSLLSSEAQAALKENAGILKHNPKVSIQIEGHCDAHGGIQYNLALGERRAGSVQHFLMDHGVAKSRLTTISYGKERPLVTGETEEAYAKNRRANFVITKK